MYESPEEIQALQRLLDDSHRRGTAHLRAIISGDHVLDATQLVGTLDGMKVLALSTVTAKGEPRVSAVDGHFLHGRWTFGTDGRAAKARHIAARPAVSAAHLDGERLGVFCHGTAVRLTPEDPAWQATLAHWTGHYGSDPTTWGDDIRMYRIEPSFMVGYRGAARMNDLSPRLRAVIEALPLRSGLRVLEIGGAPGTAARAVAAAVGDTGHVLVVDRSATGIARTERNCRAEIERGVISVLVDRVEDLQLPPGTAPFDLVFACRVGVLDGRHPREHPSAIARLRAATVPGARLFVDTGSPLDEIDLHEPPLPRAAPGGR
ncbi:pyridoxamine 5'-phosphate oxidase family protein [Microbacterium sp.]|uniref:methyltransferase domain-containing protein n=1 Tax=Microbacterium sp. TaxID=51671 RepID=UPI002810B8CB|nr:pyridoxamine 5'-phosphate oxidase family protein [Microbacterium sp.]